MLAWYMLSSCVSECVFVCVSVCHTPVLYKMAKFRMAQTVPHDSPGTVVFHSKGYGKIPAGSPPTGVPNAGDF